MFKENFKCPHLAECKGKKQRETKDGLVSTMCARCEASKERILSELEASSKK